MLTFSKLSKGYGQKTLFTDISFRILQGDRIGLVGPNGAGKTTLINAIAGIRRAGTGEVRLDDRDLHKIIRPDVPVLGIVPQDDLIRPALHVDERPL